MDHVYLTGCGLRVSRICLGTMTFGGQIDEANGCRAVDCALDHGVNFIDTANMYCDGESERIVGKALAGRRDKFILATKVGQQQTTADSGTSRNAILREAERSLKRLGTDYIDLYYLHVPDYQAPPEETIAALDDLVRSGKIRYVGTSNFAAWQICRLTHLAKQTGKAAPIATQAVYNLVTRGVEQELVPFLEEYRQALVVYNPLAGGLLTEKYADKKQIADTRLSANKTYEQRYWNDENLTAWDNIRRIAGEAGMGMVELAMRWLIATGRVDSIITGFSSLEQLRRNLDALDGPLPGNDTLQACDAVWNSLSGTRFRYNR